MVRVPLTVVLAFMAGLTTMPSAVDAAMISFCIHHTGSFTDDLDEDIVEDYWTTDLAKPAFGAWAQVRKGSPSGPVVWGPGYLGDGLTQNPGCTGNIWVTSPNDTYWISVGSWGQVDGQIIESWNGRFASQGQWLTYVAQGSVTIQDNGAMFWYHAYPTIPPGTPNWNVFSQYLITAYSVYRSAGTLPPGQLFKVVLTDSQYHTPGYASLEGIVYFSHASNWSQRKFLAAHEVGHRYAHLRTGSRMMSQRQVYDIYDTACPVDIPGGIEDDPEPENPDPIHHGSSAHGIRSLEYAGAAVGEGFAHFYAAHTWNNPAHTDCWFGYYVTICNGQGCEASVNCESGNSAGPGASLFPRQLMRTRPCTSPYTDFGTELDWLRAFWDVRTNKTYGAGASLDSIGTWLEQASATGWMEDTAYSVLDDEAQLHPAIRDLWNDTKIASGPTCYADCNGLQ